jgi:hypothetical protein
MFDCFKSYIYFYVTPLFFALISKFVLVINYFSGFCGMFII